MQKTPVVVVDIETTGLSPYRHKITEIAAAKIINGKVVDKFEQLVNPKVKISSFITKLTGITNDLVEDSPEIQDVMPSFRKFLGDHTFVAHNASFDFKFLAYNMKSYEERYLDNTTLCTQKLANRILPDLHSKRLGVICEHYGITNNQAHRAMGDTLATVNIFDKMIKTLEKYKITKIQEVINFERMPRSKASDFLFNNQKPHRE